MTVYVDRLAPWGWKPHGEEVESCHLFTDTLDLTELHALAVAIGMRRAWFQESRSAPHYDLTPERRLLAVARGAVPVDWDAAVVVWRTRRALVAGSAGPVSER